MEKQCLSAANVLPASSWRIRKTLELINLLVKLEPAIRVERTTC